MAPFAFFCFYSERLFWLWMVSFSCVEVCLRVTNEKKKRIFFKRKLFKNYEITSVTSQALFSTSFMLSCMFFVLILFEILNVMDVGTRFWYWKLALHSMLMLQIVVLPLYQIYTLLFVSLSIARRRVAALLMTFLMILWL